MQTIKEKGLCEISGYHCGIGKVLERARA